MKIMLSLLIDNFPMFSGLFPNVSKYEITGIGVLKNVNTELCRMNNVDLTKETIKNLSEHISYNKKLIREHCQLHQTLAYEKTDFRRPDYYF